MSAGVIRAANTVFSVGFLFGTIGSSGAAGMGLVSNVPFGQLQDFSFDDSFSLKELMGSTQLTAISVGISELKVTGQAKFAQIRARQWQMLRGGAAPVVVGGSTLIRRLTTDEPTPFNLHLMSPSDGSDIELKIYNCIAPKLAANLKLKDFVIPEFGFNAYGDPTTGILMDILVPGDQTAS